MPQPINYSHLTPQNITDGRKYHVTDEELDLISQYPAGSGTWVYGDLVELQYEPSIYDTDSIYLSAHLQGIDNALSGGVTGSSTLFFNVADDISGTGSRWVRMNTVTYSISGINRTLYYQ